MGCQTSSAFAREKPLPFYNSETSLALLTPKERVAAVNAVEGAVHHTVDEETDISNDFDLRSLKPRPPRWLVMIDRSSKDLSALSNTADPGQAPTIEKVSVKAVLDGATMELHDGRTIRLAGVAVPQKGEPYYKKAKRLLEHFALNQWVYLDSAADEVNIIPDYEFATPIAETLKQGVLRRFRERRARRLGAKRTKATQKMLSREESQRKTNLALQKQRQAAEAERKKKEADDCNHPEEGTKSPTRKRPPPRESEEESPPTSPLKRNRQQPGFVVDVPTQNNRWRNQTRSSAATSPLRPASPPMPPSTKAKRVGNAPTPVATRLDSQHQMDSMEMMDASVVPLPPVVYLRTVYTILEGERGYLNLNAAVVAYGLGTVLLEDGRNGYDVPKWMQEAVAKREREAKAVKRVSHLQALQQGDGAVYLPRKPSASDQKIAVPDLLSPLDPTQSVTQPIRLASPVDNSGPLDPSRPPYTYPSNRAHLLDCLRNAIVCPVGRWIAEERLLAKVFVPVNSSRDRKYLHHRSCPSLVGANEVKASTFRRGLVMGRSPCPLCRSALYSDCDHLSKMLDERERAAEDREIERRIKFKQQLLDEYETKKKEMQDERQRVSEAAAAGDGGK